VRGGSVPRRTRRVLVEPAGHGCLTRHRRTSAPRTRGAVVCAAGRTRDDLRAEADEACGGAREHGRKQAA